MNNGYLKIIVFVGLLVLSIWLLINKIQKSVTTLPSNDDVVEDKTQTPIKENVINDMLVLNYPSAGDIIISPLRVTGNARGGWFFEGSFPVVLTDWDGLIIAKGIAQADGEWMTDEFVPFSAELNFVVPEYGMTGSLILKKANPSGLAENNDAVEIKVNFR